MNNRQFVLFALLGLTYFLGETSQIFVIGPNWFRWYVSDFGFVFAISFSYNYVFNFPLKTCVVVSFLIAASSEILFNFDPIDMTLFCLSFAISWIIILTTPSKQ